jgi:DNA-binding CsgD family transcriptional regulator
MLMSRHNALPLSERARLGTANQLGLTPTELRVRNRVICGDSNAAIAARYVVTEKTVQKHLANVYDKLGLGEDLPSGAQDQANKRVLLTQLAIRRATAWAREAVRPRHLALLQALAYQASVDPTLSCALAEASRELGALCTALTPLALREGVLPLANEPGQLSAQDAAIFNLLADGQTLGTIARWLREGTNAAPTPDDTLVVEQALWRIAATLLPLVEQW